MAITTSINHFRVIEQLNVIRQTKSSILIAEIITFYHYHSKDSDKDRNNYRFLIVYWMMMGIIFYRPMSPLESH